MREGACEEHAHSVISSSSISSSLRSLRNRTSTFSDNASDASRSCCFWKLVRYFFFSEASYLSALAVHHGGQAREKRGRPSTRDAGSEAEKRGALPALLEKRSCAPILRKSVASIFCVKAFSSTTSFRRTCIIIFTCNQREGGELRGR